MWTKSFYPDDYSVETSDSTIFRTWMEYGLKLRRSKALRLLLKFIANAHLEEFSEWVRMEVEK